MDAQTVVATIAACISLVAMAVAIWQASEARKSREVAASQARTAEETLVETRKQTQLARDANTHAALNVDAAEKAANASQASADEARKANALTAEQHSREDAAQDAAAVAHARKVRSRILGMGGYSIQVTNDADEPFYNIALEEVQRADHPSWGWRLARSVMGNRGVRDTIKPSGGKCSFYIEFLDESDAPQPFNIGDDTEFGWTITYADASGQQWRRTVDATPERVGP